MSSIIEERFNIFMEAQVEEIYKYKWILGEQMHRDPLDNFSMSDICSMWILNNANKFRMEWIQCHGSGYFNGDV